MVPAPVRTEVQETNPGGPFPSTIGSGVDLPQASRAVADMRRPPLLSSIHSRRPSSASLRQTWTSSPENVGAVAGVRIHPGASGRTRPRQQATRQALDRGRQARDGPRRPCSSPHHCGSGARPSPNGRTGRAGPAARFLSVLAEHELEERARRRVQRHLSEARLLPGKAGRAARHARGHAIGSKNRVWDMNSPPRPTNLMPDPRPTRKRTSSRPAEKEIAVALRLTGGPQ